MNIEAVFYRQLDSSRAGYLMVDSWRKSLCDLFLRCAEAERLRATANALGFTADDLSPEQLFDLYLEQPSFNAVSPNALFDEQWYRQNNPDVVAAIEDGRFRSGFLHFIQAGLLAGRWPSEVLKVFAARHLENPPPSVSAIADVAYLSTNPEARSFLKHFPIIESLAHYNSYGRFLGLTLPPTNLGDCKNTSSAGYFDTMADAFDAEWYRAQYLVGDAADRFHQDPFSHYLIRGIPCGYSPNAGFDEAFYRVFYPDVREAIAGGEIPCGFYHYAVAGKAEARLPHYDRKRALEARIPGVTKPVLLQRLDDVRARIQERRVTVDPKQAATIWVLLPTMNPDITFGGYRSAFELVRRLHDRGQRVTIICTEDGQADKSYFLWREPSASLRRVIQGISVVGLAAGRNLVVGPADTVIVYSLWDLVAADQIRRSAPATRVILLAQEFEPVFYDHCTARAQLVEAYRIQHYPLINSGFLQRYFEQQRIGVFARSPPPQHGRDYFTFEHKINRLVEQSAAQMATRRERVLIAYARPEAHAVRNMFETLILALQQVHSEGLFGPEWTFIGLGALTDIEAVPLGGTHTLIMRPKMSEEEYTRYVSMMDIGVSLMYAPHPSVMPFEFATTGALVVTNSYENRSEADLSAISNNIIAGPPTIAGIAQALREAIERVPDIESRVRNIYRPKATNWDEIFTDDMLDIVFSSQGEIAAS
jgi:hypothetical protein